MTFGLVLAMGSVSISSLSAQTRDLAIGTWKLNVAMSKFAGPPLKNQTRTFEDRGDGVLIFTSEGIDAEGKPTFISYTVKRDGKDYPTGVNPTTGARNSISARLIDDYTLEFTNKANGKITGRGSRNLSKDGKTLTYKDAQGQTTLVFDRQ